MLEFRDEMDPHSRTMLRDGRPLGYVQWHPNTDVRLVVSGWVAFTMAELCQIGDEMLAAAARKGKKINER